MPGTLYLIATPIGNLKDISLRALEILKSVEIIACEDTRHTRKLLNAYGISGKLVSYHEHNEETRADELISRLFSGDSVAVVSDAGTPAINDPGFRIVQKAHDKEIPIVPIPGPVAFINAAIVSGLPTDSIFFGGFLPARKGERRKCLQEVADIPATLVFYETPHRLAASLKDCLEVLGDRAAAIVRELTKLHEEIIRGSLSELASKFDKTQIKGEIVLVIERANLQKPARSKGELSSQIDLPTRVALLEAESFDRKSALKQAAKEFGLSKSEAYKILLKFTQK